MRITLKQLQVFDAVARQGTVSRAADEIALSQSAASMALAELEQQLGAALFHRQGKKLRLNEYGRWLKPKVHQLLQQVIEIEQSAQLGTLHGQIKIGASSTIGNYFLPAIIADFIHRHPTTGIELKVGNTSKVVEDMLNLEIDLGFIEGPCHTQRLSVTPWRQDILQIFCSPQHRLAKKQNIEIADLQAESWILREAGSGTQEIFETVANKKLGVVNVKLELGNSEAIKQAVKSGIALGCLSKLAIAAEVEHGELTVINVKELNFEREFSMIQSKTAFESQVLEHFKNAVIAAN